VVLKFRTGDEERTSIPIVAVSANEAKDRRTYIELAKERIVAL
jgi:hypothetical protein